MKIGFFELLVIFLVALFVIGPDKLPYYAKRFGAALREFKKATGEMTDELKKTVVEPVREAKEPLEEALRPLDALAKDIEGSTRDLERSVKDIGSKKAEKPKSRLEEQEEEIARQRAEILELKARLEGADSPCAGEEMGQPALEGDFKEGSKGGESV